MLACVVPAHNEEAHIGDCLAALRNAAAHPALQSEPTELIVVLDRCTDATEALARHAGATVLQVDARNVGVARDVGARVAIARGARWLAFTDADTQVEPDWLAQQLELRSSVVCGTVQIADWSEFAPHVRQQHERSYCDRDGHRHVHGANLGVCAAAYAQAGGFDALHCHEDVALVGRLIAEGFRVAWSARPRVITSARRRARVQGGGFASHLAALEGSTVAGS